jgi:Tol biopolymer transport system component
MFQARCTAHRAIHLIAHHLLACLLAGTAAAQSPQPTIFLNINPSWSPDGRQLVFESARHGNTTLYIINADGTGERRLTSTGRGDDTHPQWSPDGRTILFDSDRDGAFHLYTIRPDGTGEQRLTVRDTSRALTVARHPSWSPDGRRIVFDSDRDGNADIYVMDGDGRNVRRLTQHPASDGHASWSPDGTRIIFGS